MQHYSTPTSKIKITNYTKIINMQSARKITKQYANIYTT